MHFTDPNYWTTWTPDPEHINALPEPVRRYIHDLETRVDPEGEIQELVRLKAENAALIRKIQNLESQRWN